MNWKIEITAEEQKKEKRMKKIEDSLRDLLDNIKCTNSQIIGVPEEEEKKKGCEKIFEEIAVEKLFNMGKEASTYVQEAQRKTQKKYTKEKPKQTIDNGRDVEKRKLTRTFGGNVN